MCKILAGQILTFFSNYSQVIRHVLHTIIILNVYELKYEFLKFSCHLIYCY